MKKQKAKLLAIASAAKDFPPEEAAEYAFVGPSNVGKSALINAIAREKIARTSATPGRTRQIFFFQIAPKTLLVDLPGYGFAKAGKAERNKWKELIEAYLLGRNKIKTVFALLDCRRTVSERDLALFEWLDHNKIPYIVTLTKIDKLSKHKVFSAVAAFRRQLKLPPEKIIATSAEKNIGIDLIKKILANEPPP